MVTDPVNAFGSLARYIHRRNVIIVATPALTTTPLLVSQQHSGRTIVQQLLLCQQGTRIRLQVIQAMSYQNRHRLLQVKRCILGFDGRQLICCVRTKAQISLRIMQSDECLCCSLYKNNITLNLLVIPRHFKKCGVLCYTLHSKNCVRVSVRSSSCPSVRLSVCMSVCMSVRPFVRQPIVFTLCWEHFFNQFSSNLP